MLCHIPAESVYYINEAVNSLMTVVPLTSKARAGGKLGLLAT